MHPRFSFSAAWLATTLLLTASQSLGGSITLEWDPNTESDLAGYRVYYGETSGQYSSSVDVGLNTLYEVAGLEEGKTYFFAVTAYDRSGNESGYSNEVSATVETTKDPEEPEVPKDPDEPEDPEEPPRLPVLYQNYPNPFSALGGSAVSSGAQGLAGAINSPTQIRFEIPEAGHVTVKVFDALGRELLTLLDADLAAGIHRVYWDGRGPNGWILPSGTYFYQLNAGGIVQTKRMSFAR